MPDPLGRQLHARSLTPLLDIYRTQNHQELRRLVDDCWAADPEARPSFEDVVTRLEKLLKDMPKHAHFSKANEGCCSVQ